MDGAFFLRPLIKEAGARKKEDVQETVLYVNFSKFVQAESGNDDFLRK